jgi:hypothetical protein
MPQSFKQLGSRLVSFETADPYEVSVLVPLASRRRVTDRRLSV